MLRKKGQKGGQDPGPSGPLRPWKEAWSSQSDGCIGTSGTSTEHDYSFVHFI